MSLVVPENQLPQQLSPEQAVEAAYATELAEAASDLIRGLPVLIECDKDLAPFLFIHLRSRLKQHDLRCLYLDGRPRDDEQPQQGMQDCSFVATMIRQLRAAVRGAVERRVVVLPHLDLLTTSQGGLTQEAREVIPLLYENPELVWLGFKDPSFSLPQVIENLFPRRYGVLGVDRMRLRHLITQKESRKFGRDFNPWSLYKYVSGINAVKLRKLLSTLEGEDYPASPRRVYQQIRQATTGGTLEIPTIDLDKDIGGYETVKRRIKSEILEILTRKDQKEDAEEIRRLEELIPKGIILWGPPGTGKTLFAKAIATAIGAAVTIVSGPELKSRWVGESEENLRQIFYRARQSAPAIIVFDELDSFASARGTYTGSGVEHSMVNQLLTEMDGFHKEEMVFVVGTTNFVDILDPALLRPGRFEVLLQIPLPGADDRRAILKIYDGSMGLKMSDDALEYAVRRTGDYVEGAAIGTRYSGDHINALCRAIARIRLRDDMTDHPTDNSLIERALTEWVERPNMTAAEQRVVAVHEAGHAVCALFCEHTAPIERISIQGDMAGALGFVRHQDPAHRYVVTEAELRDDLCVLMGGREAELLLLGELSIGSSADIQRATDIARALVEEFGMGGNQVGVCSFRDNAQQSGQRRELSAEQLAALDARIREILEEQRQRAAKLLSENRALVETLRDMLLKDKTIDAKTLGSVVAASGSANSSPTGQ